MALSRIMKEVYLDMILSDNHMCEHFLWNEKRSKFYCNCYRGFMRLEDICPVYRCIACNQVDNCTNAPCDSMCAIYTDFSLEI